MKLLIGIATFLLFATLTFRTQAQADSIKAPIKHTRSDSVHLAKMNTTGNLMIGGGIGITAVGGYLLYTGTRIYQSTLPHNTPDDIKLNHKQGTIYMVAGGVGIVGGLVLVALGAKSKIEFKRYKKLMTFQPLVVGPSGIGMAFNF